MKKSILFSAFLASVLLGANIDFNEADKTTKRVNPEFDTDIILSYHSSIIDAKKSVVNIATTKTIKGNNQINELFNDPFFKEFFGFNFGIPQEKTRKANSLGSGVIISKDGYIVTNNHVIENSDEILVTLLDDETEYKAKLIGSDPKTDIAIIKIDAKDLKAVKFGDSANLMEGDIVFAIGNPFGVGGTITQGIISALNKNNIGLNQYENFIQTDASINPGNSGGALVDSRGALIGINSAILSRSGGDSGVGFAIPSNMVKEVATKLIVDGKIERGYIGVGIGDLNKELKETYKNTEGALIEFVEKDTPADKAGLKLGDLIIKVNGKAIKNANELKNTIGAMKPNESVEVEFERQKEIKKVKIKLDSMDKTFTSNDEISSGIDGLLISNLNDEFRAKFRLDSDIKGVLVTNVKSESEAEKKGFEKGDVIIQIGSENIKNIEDFKTQIKNQRKSEKKFIVWVMRGGKPQGLVIK